MSKMLLHHSCQFQFQFQFQIQFKFQVNDILHTVDKDKSGTIDFQEYLHMMRVYNDIAAKEMEEERAAAYKADVAEAEMHPHLLNPQ